MSSAEPNRNDQQALLGVHGLSKHHRVAAPWLERLLGGRSQRVLRAVDEVSFSLRAGETFGLVGESGSGKTTLARLLVGLDRPTKGRILFQGTDVHAVGSRIDMARLRRNWQMIFQNPYSSLNPRWRVGDIIAEPIRAFRLEESRQAARARVAELLRQVGLSPGDMQRYPHEFSNGQRQRIAIARALASSPRFIVCDEPTSALDVSVQAQILNLMKDLQRRHDLAYLFISHDLAVVHYMADRIGVMYLGRLCEVAPAAELIARPRHPYTRLLLDAMPGLHPAAQRPVVPRGEPPDPMSPPDGCSFHPRCPLADARCRRERPASILSQSAYVACHAVEEGRQA
jgi:peptide/nickel transport system ATP-binding protein